MKLGRAIHFNKPAVAVICSAFLILIIYMISNKWNEAPQVIKNNNKINLKQLLTISIQTAENGGLQVLAATKLTPEGLKIQSKGKTKEGMEDSVTTADFWSHCAMMKVLRHFYPDLNIVSEEANAVCDPKQKVVIDYDYNNPLIPTDLGDQWVNQEDVTLWIDPLDATHEYTEKLYKYVSTMVCVAVKGKPVIGVIHKPFVKFEPKTSWAWVDFVKSPDLNQIIQEESSYLTIIISKSHSGDVRKILDRNFGTYELVTAAGAGYKVLEVLRGLADAYIHITAIKKWDICAGNAMINAAGGRFTTKEFQLIDYSNSSVVENNDGLIVTMDGHEVFRDKLN